MEVCLLETSKLRLKFIILCLLAYEPVFWMHHCNCDRLFALWQAMNYDVYVSEGMSYEATINYLPGQVLSEDSRKFELLLSSFDSNRNPTFSSSRAFLYQKSGPLAVG